MSFIIAGVPYVSFWADDMAYMTSFVASVYGAFKTIGNPIKYGELLAVSGYGSRAVWKPGAWSSDSLTVKHNDIKSNELQERLLRIYGWSFLRLTRLDGQRRIRAEVKKSIDRGRPVILRGLCSESSDSFSIFFGYKKGGSILIGYDYDSKDEKTCMHYQWTENVAEVVILLEMTRKVVSERRRAWSAFAAMMTMGIRSKDTWTYGAEAWSAVAEDLENEQDWKGLSEGQESLLLEQRLRVYGDFLCLVHQRGHILHYLRVVALRIMPEFREQIKQLIRYYQECASYGGYLWRLGITFTPTGSLKFADPEIRRKLAAECRRCGRNEAAALEVIRLVVEEETKVATPTRVFVDSTLSELGLPAD